MTRRCAVTVTALVVAVLPACTSAVGHAGPAVPLQDAPCTQSPSGTLTRLADSKALVECRDGRWEPFTGMFPSSDNWLTYGPELTLRGQARRNPEMMAGIWVGIPQSPESQCSATQSNVIVAGQMAPPEVVAGEPGQPLRLALTTQLASIELTGSCLWEREP